MIPPPTTAMSTRRMALALSAPVSPSPPQTGALPGASVVRDTVAIQTDRPPHMRRYGRAYFGDYRRQGRGRSHPGDEHARLSDLFYQLSDEDFARRDTMGGGARSEGRRSPYGRLVRAHHRGPQRVAARPRQGEARAAVVTLTGPTTSLRRRNGGTKGWTSDPCSPRRPNRSEHRQTSCAGVVAQR